MGNVRMAFILSSSEGSIGRGEIRGQEIIVEAALLLGAVEASWGVFSGSGKAHVLQLPASPRGHPGDWILPELVVRRLLVPCLTCSAFWNLLACADISLFFVWI